MKLTSIKASYSALWAIYLDYENFLTFPAPVRVGFLLFSFFFVVNYVRPRLA
jgi:hypothetical protein